MIETVVYDEPGTEREPGMNARATLSVPEAARLLVICEETAYRLNRRGQLPGAVRLGHRVVVRRAVLGAWLAGAAE